MQVFVWMYVFAYLGMYLGLEVQGHRVILCLTIRRTGRLFCAVAAPFCTPPAQLEVLLSTSWLALERISFWLMSPCVGGMGMPWLIRV